MNTYKRFLIILIIVIFILGVIVHPVIFFINLNKKNLIEQYLNEWINIKEKYSNENGNKIVILSGSNTIFGVDAQKMEKELNMPVLNGGTHAVLHEYIFYWAEENILKDGDIVIMPLEYEQYENNLYGDEYLAYILGYDSDYFNTFSLYDKIKFIYKVSPQSLLDNIKDLVINKILEEYSYSPKYSSKYLNYNGDMTDNKVENKKTNEQLMQTIKNTVFVEDEVPCKEFKKEMENFIKYCNEHNIKIYATWPAYLYDKKEFSNPDLEKINNIEEYYNSKNIKVLGNYTDSIYDINLFYDSYYHLNEEGKSIRTKYLINLIKEEILK